MVDVSALLAKMAEILIFILIGAAGRKLRYFSEESSRALSQIIANIGIPALLLATVMTAPRGTGAGELLAFLGLSFLWQGLLLLLALLVARFLAPRGSERGTYAFVMAFGNLGIFGLAVIQPLFGAAGMLKALLMNSPFNCMTYTVGLVLVQGGRRPRREDVKKMLNPGLVVAATSPFLYLLDIPWPSSVVSAFTLVGNMTLPLLMFTVGSTLAAVKPRELLTMPKVLIVSAMRLLVLPVLIWSIFRLFVHDPVSMGVITILSATPGAGLAVALNVLYGEHEKEASLAIFVSTMLSIVTIPLLTLLLLT